MVIYDDKSDDEMHQATLQLGEGLLNSRGGLSLSCSKWQSNK